MSTEPTAEDKARYDAIRKELLQALPKKRGVDRQLVSHWWIQLGVDANTTQAQLEVQLYAFEGSYLTETAAHSGGNIIQGFEGYLKNQSVTRRKYEVSDSDRMFSNSSLTCQKVCALSILIAYPTNQFAFAQSLDLFGEGEESTATADDFHNQKQSTPISGSISGLTTVVVPPATRGQELSAAQQKKNRDREYQRRKRASASRQRSTGTISDEEVAVSSSAGTGRARKRARMADDD